MKIEEKVSNQQVAISRKKILGDLPVLISEIADDCLLTGFIGLVDMPAMKKITDNLLWQISEAGCDFAIIDLSHLEFADPAVLAQLGKLCKSLKLVGAEVIICGVKPGLAQLMTGSAFDMDKALFEKNMKRALKRVYQLQGLQLQPAGETYSQMR